MKKGFCIFSILFLLLTPFSVSAETNKIDTDNTYLTDQDIKDPSRYPSTFTVCSLPSGNNVCSVSLSEGQRNFIISNDPSKDAQYNFIGIINGTLYAARGLWQSSCGSNTWYTSSSCSGNCGFYKLNSNGSLTAATTPTGIPSVVYDSSDNWGGNMFSINTSSFAAGCAGVVSNYTLSLSVSPSAGGSVSGAGTYASGTSVTISATPNQDFRFKQWSDGNTSNPRTITISSNTSLIAQFESTVSNPSVNLPTPNQPNFTFNTEQSDYINLISSPVIQGGSINYFRYDFFNIYAVHSTSLTDEIFNNNEDFKIKYQIDSTGRYIIPVYDHSEIVLYAPNMSVSSSGFSITPSIFSNVSYSWPESNGIIQRDIQRFDYTYVDLQMLNQYPYEDLPFSNSSTNTGKVDYLGQQLSVRSGGTASRSLSLTLNGQNYSTSFYFVVTDSYEDIEEARSEETRTIINNNINNNFSELDSTLQHGNSLTQGSKNNLDTANNSLNSTINQYNQLDQQANQDLINDLNAIDLNDFAINGLIQLSNSSNFVRTQFNNLTANNPIGTSVGFALVVGLSLLLLAKRL